MACLQDQTHNVNAHATEFARAVKLVENEDKKEQKDLGKLKTEANRAKNSTTQASSAPEGAGNDLLQINAGPAALAMTMIFEAIGLYADIINLQKEQRVAMVETQANAAQASADATIDEGKAAMGAAIAAGTFMIVGAAASMGALYVCKDKMANDEFANVNARVKPMEGVQGSLDEPVHEPADAGRSSAAAADAASDVPSKGVPDLMREFKDHDYSNAGKDPEKTREAISRLKQFTGEDSLPEGFEDFDGFNYSDWKQNFFKRFDADRSELLSITNRQTAASQKAQVVSQLATSAGSSGSTVAQGVGQMRQTEHRAASGLDQVASSMAGGDQQQAASAMKSADDAQKQEVQILREIDRSNSVQV